MRIEYFQLNVDCDLLRSKDPDTFILFTATWGGNYSDAEKTIPFIHDVSPVKSEITDNLLMDVIEWGPVMGDAVKRAVSVFQNKYCIGSRALGDITVHQNGQTLVQETQGFYQEN